MRKIILAALTVAAIAPASAAPTTDDKPKVFTGPIIVEPACVPGECSGK